MADILPKGTLRYPLYYASHPPKIAIEHGRVIDPANGRDETATVALADRQIVSVAQSLPEGFLPDITIDAHGRWVVPGFVDMHVHLREPGREDKETIATGTQAAAAGGITAVACMPNTSPVLDEESMIRHVIERAQNCPSRVYPVGSITKNLSGEKLSPMGEMVAAGAVALSDDGKAVASTTMMRNAMNYAKSFKVPVLCHSEDAELAGGGHMNESSMSTRLGIRGIPSISEEIGVARDIMLAEYTGSRVHICHISTAGSVRLVRAAKARGVAVTCETCPHYFVFTDESLEYYDTHKKMNPPLRTQADRQAIIEGIADGTIDAIATDHAPHTAEEKDVEFDAAAFGVIGLETSIAAATTWLVRTDIVSPSTLVERMSIAPNRILGLEGGTLSAGALADVTILDPQWEWRVSPGQFYSKSRNTPFEDMVVTGCATQTIVDGHVVFDRSASD
jgi:dihydroorotase